MFSINDVPVDIKRFPDQTINLKLAVESKKVTIEWLYEKDEEFTLYLIVKHLKAQYKVEQINLYLPYVPHARMDRVKNQEEVFTLKYFCEFINSLCFYKVVVRDVHSNVSLALINNVEQEPINKDLEILASKILDSEKDIVFYPDEGSCKRYSDLIKFPQAFGIKKRDWSTGKIEGLTVQGEVPNKPFNVLIIDDISSYGGTFYHAATKLKELGADKIYLYITHCENSILKGDLINSGLLEKIYTTKSIYTGHHELIEVL